MMDLYSSIFRRKSCRSYTGQPCSSAQLKELEAAIAGFRQLYADVPLQYRLVQEVKGTFKAAAPHFLIVHGQGKAGEMESAGFLFEQLVLWLDANGIGSVWLGNAKDSAQPDAGNDIITIAFGEGSEPVHRSADAFKRKPLAEITNAPEDSCMQAVQLAPSGVNLQPWYFEQQGQKVFVYRQLLKPPMSLLYKKTEVDMGIALCHYALACEQVNKPFVFSRKSDGAAKKGYQLFGELA